MAELLAERLNYPDPNKDYDADLTPSQLNYLKQHGINSIGAFTTSDEIDPVNATIRQLTQDHGGYTDANLNENLDLLICDAPLDHPEDRPLITMDTTIEDLLKMGYSETDAKSIIETIEDFRRDKNY